MSKKGENIYKRRDGRWEARYIKGYDPSGRARYGSCYGKSYREARDKRILAKSALLQNDPPESGGSKRFGFYCREWLSMSRARLRESTYVKYATMLERHIEPEFGEYRLSALTTAMIAEFGQKLLSDGLSPKTARDILVFMHTVLEYAQTQEPASRPIRVIYPKAERKEIRVLSREEQQRLTSYLLENPDECKFGVLLTLLTGLRVGEVCALRWGDVSLADRTLTVSSTMLRLKDYDAFTTQKTKIVLTDPKTNTSARVIPLTEYAANLCRRFWVSDPAAFILTGQSDRYVEPRVLQYRFEKYTSECGLSGVHFHALRHTFATRCVEVGFEIKSLSEILGHTSPKFTLERYVHSSLELKRDNMDKLSIIGC